MDENVVNNLKSESRWLRLVFMVVFGIVAYLAAFLVLLIALVQAVHGFFTSEPNERLLKFSAGVNQFIYQIAGFLTYNTDVKPYPFSDWPQPVANSSEKVASEPDND